MKKSKHSLGWHTAKELTVKVKRQRVVIILLVLLWVLSVLFCCSGGR